MDEIEQPEIADHDRRDHDGDGRKRPPEILPTNEAWGRFKCESGHAATMRYAEPPGYSTTRAAGRPGRQTWPVRLGPVSPRLLPRDRAHSAARARRQRRA